MKIYTSNFAVSGKNPKAVAICCMLPKYYHGAWYTPLAPEKWMLKLKDGEYTRIYNKHILGKLNQYEVANAVGDGAILLCYEKYPSFCHRYLVAEWLNQVGIETEEILPASAVEKVESVSPQLSFLL